MRYALLALLTLALSGCSLIISDTECEADADCPTGTCTADGLCDVGASSGCADDSQCAADEMCDEGACAPLIEGMSCERMGSDAEDALVLGFIMTFSGPDKEGGVSQRQVVELALDEINNSGGVSGKQQRPLAFMACDDKADAEHAKAALRYFSRAGIPATLGPGFSSVLEEGAVEVGIPEGIFMLSPSSTAASIRDLNDDDLVWRVSSSDTGQTNTLAYFALWLAFEVAYAEADDPMEEITILAVHTLDNYGGDFRQGFEQSLQASAGVLLSSEDFEVEFLAEGYDNAPESETWDADVAALVTKIADSSPDILLFVGYDSTADILAQVKDIPELANVPLLLTDGTLSQKLATTYRTAGEMPEHVFGVQPGIRDGKAYEHFRTQHGLLGTGDPVPPNWTEFTYDAVYLLTYAAASMAPDELTGAGFAQAFKRFDDEDGTRLLVGPSQLIVACDTMADGANLDVLGASGALDFDPSTGEPRTVGILRWTLDAPESEDSTEVGTIEECGPAELYEGGVKTTIYWCNALCMTPDADNLPCPDDDRCEGEDAYCSSELCAQGDDCKPELAP